MNESFHEVEEWAGVKGFTELEDSTEKLSEAFLKSRKTGQWDVKTRPEVAVWSAHMLRAKTKLMGNPSITDGNWGDLNEAHHSLIYLMSTINNAHRHSYHDPSDNVPRYLAEELSIPRMASGIWTNATLSDKSQFLSDCESTTFEKDQGGELRPFEHQTTVALISHLLSTLEPSSFTQKK